MHNFRGSFVLLYVCPSNNILRKLFSSQKLKCNYEILGLTPKATSAQIKKAYYVKSKQFHPDLNSSLDAALEFQKVNVAYEVLSNEESRKEYDRHRGYNTIPKPTVESSQNDNAYFNKKIHFRMQRHNYTTEYNHNSKHSPAWQKVKDEYEFFKHLPDDMKKNYEEYVNRVKEEQKENVNKSSEDTDAYSFTVAVVGVVIVIFLFQKIGDYTGILTDNSTYNKTKKD